MFPNLVWRGSFEVSDAGKVARIAARMAKLTDSDVQVRGSERYWKDDRLFVATMQTPLGEDRLDRAVLRSLQIAGLIASPWWVTPPHEHPGDRWEFEGYASTSEYCHFRLPGIETLSFRISNFDDQPPA
jgi:hypothetical protein